MKFRQLEVFLAVTAFKSFSAAAEDLCLSQPTVTSHMKALEENLGCELIQRTTKSLMLTENGEIFLNYAKRIIELRDAAQNEMRQCEHTMIRLGASTIPSEYLLPQFLAQFRSQNPNTYFNIRQGDSSEIEQRIIDGSLEIGLIGKSSDASSCVSIPLCADRIVLATPATDYYLNLRETHPGLSDLLKEPIIMREKGSGTQKAANRYLDSQNISTESLKIIAYNNDLESIKQMIIEGLGISLISEFAVTDLANRGQILIYPLDAAFERRFYLVYLKNRPLKPKIKNLIDAIQRYFLSVKNQRKA